MATEEDIDALMALADKAPPGSGEAFGPRLPDPPPSIGRTGAIETVARRTYATEAAFTRTDGGPDVTG